MSIEKIFARHLTGTEAIALVVQMYYFVVGLSFMLLGFVIGRIHPRKWNMFSNLMYIAGMSLIIFAIFGLGDPIEWIPSEVWSILQYVIVVFTFYGFLYKIESDMRSEINDKVKTLKEDFGEHLDNLKSEIGILRSDIHRDIDRLERMLEKRK
jgi:hypothetical protein